MKPRPFKAITLKPNGGLFVMYLWLPSWHMRDQTRGAISALSWLLASCVDSVYLSSGKGNQYRETWNKKHFKWTAQARN